jgi:hypothetical protein
MMKHIVGTTGKTEVKHCPLCGPDQDTGPCTYDVTISVKPGSVTFTDNYCGSMPLDDPLSYSRTRAPSLPVATSAV